jgi:YVTN family beta-propeller protein
MVTRFGTYWRTLLVGPLALGGAIAVTVIGGSQSAPPAAAATPTPWTAYVVSYEDDAVIPVNTATDAVGAPITVGSGPSAIAISPNASTAYVTDEGTTNTAPGFVTPIDLSTGTPGTPIAVGSGPDAIAITPNGLTAYVGNYNDDTVTPINLATNTPGNPIPVGAAPTAITISPDGSTAYVTQAFADDDIPIDTATNKAGPGLLNTYDGFASAITPDGATLYTPNFRDNGVATLDPATDARGSIAALDDPEGVAITPDGSTAYVTYANTFNSNSNNASLLPIDTATGTPGTPIALGTSAAEGIAITPDGSTAFVTDQVSNTVTPVDLASATAGTPISLGTSGNNPVAIAITPDQAPIAHLNVTLAPNGSPSTFNASASTVAYGTIASYDWNFGDGTTDITTTPVTTHTYTGGSYAASVIETSSTGTSTAQVFTGQTASQNGGPQATATALGSLAGGGPIVASVSPDIGSTGGPTVVTITGSGFTSETGVDVGGQAATDVVFNGDSSLTATLPGQAAGADDVIVTTPIGSSAAAPADQFTYSAPVPPESVTCQTSTCSIPVVQYGDGQGDSTTVSSSVSSDCNVCSYSSSVSEGLPTPCTDAMGCCPDGMSYTQAEISVGESDDESTSPLDVLTEQIVQGQAAYAGGLPYPPPPVPQTTVCAEAQALSSGSSISGPGSGPNASSAGKKLGQNLLLTKCAKPAVAPCIKKIAVNGRDVVTTVIVPVNESVTLTAGPQKETIKKFSPKTGAPGSNVIIKGTNLTQVNEVTIGGVEASVVSETTKKLVVTVPPGASTGVITLSGWSGDVTTSSAFTVT